jgi:hypothetical protein
VPTVYSTDNDTKKHKRLFPDICAFCASLWLSYIVIVPQAIRAPEFPDGSVFMSSAFS